MNDNDDFLIRFGGIFYHAVMLKILRAFTQIKDIYSISFEENYNKWTANCDMNRRLHSMNAHHFSLANIYQNEIQMNWIAEIFYSFKTTTHFSLSTS